MNQRQAERRIFFNHLFKQMPLWEHWTTITKAYTGFYNEDGSLQVVDIPRKDFRSIPRHLRRQMARVRAKREWRVAKGVA